MKIILTIGTTLGAKIKINEIHKENFIYRINGAHGSVEEIANKIQDLQRQQEGLEILLDLPGNKVRTANLKSPIKLEAGKEFSLKPSEFNYDKFYTLLKEGMQIYANDSIFCFEVTKVENQKITFLSHSSGLLLNNKGMHIRGDFGLPFLFDKDKQLIKLAKEMGVKFLGASFVRKKDDILLLKSLWNGEFIAKIETLEAVSNLSEILPLVEFILIDRGDLSTDISLPKVPRFQKYIIEQAQFQHKKVFCATQVLKNMEEKPVPTIAEIEALYAMLKSGIFGVQLSEESAVGSYVKEAIEILEIMIAEVKSESIML